MRRLAVSLTFLPTILLLAACPLKKKEGDDAAATAAEASVAATTDEAAAPAPATATDEASAPAPAIAPSAKNAGEVARFASETKIENQAAKVAAFATAHTSPRTGGVVASLKAGTDVVKIAEYNNAFLVTFADPKDASATLMGWVNKEAFVAALDAGVDASRPDAGRPDAGAKTGCAAGHEPVVLGAGAAPVCKKKCTSDKDCTKGCQVATGANGKAVRVCASE
jgi:hypothetical protein